MCRGDTSHVGNSGKTADAAEPAGSPAKSAATRAAKRAELVATAVCATSTLAAALTFPFYQGRRDELGCDALCYGSMTSVRSALGLVGGIVVGRMSDQMGRFPALVVGAAASMSSTMLFAVATDQQGLWISMVPGALLGQSFIVWKALLADHAKAANIPMANRAGALGRLGLAAGVGIMFGPMLGGFLLSDFKTASAASLVLAFLSSLLLMFLPPDVVNAFKLEPEPELAVAVPDTPAVVAKPEIPKTQTFYDYVMSGFSSTPKSKTVVSSTSTSTVRTDKGSSSYLPTMPSFSFSNSSKRSTSTSTTTTATATASGSTAGAAAAATTLSASPKPASSSPSMMEYLGLLSSTSKPATPPPAPPTPPPASSTPSSEPVAMSAKSTSFLTFVSSGVCSTGAARLLLGLRFGLSLAFFIFNTAFTTVLKARFNFNPQMHGLYMGFMGLMYSVAQFFMAKPLIEAFAGSQQMLLAGCIVVLSLGRMTAAFAHHVALMFIGTGSVVAAIGIVNTSLSTTISQIALPDEVGGLIGVIEAVESFTGIIGPTLGGMIVTHGGETAPLLVILAIYAALILATLVLYPSTVTARVRELKAEEAKSS